MARMRLSVRFFGGTGWSGPAQPDHHIDRGYGRSVRGIGKTRDLQLFGGCVAEPVLVFPEEMRMIMGVGVEIALRSVHHDFLNQPGVTEGAKRVVDSGQGHALPQPSD